jgi:hypothetical protein
LRDFPSTSCPSHCSNAHVRQGCGMCGLPVTQTNAKMSSR